MNRFLAFDFGAESGRAILASISADSVTLREAHRFPTHNGKLLGTLHWDVLALWEEIKRGLSAASKLSADSPISGIGVDTWGVDFGLLDAAGKLLSLPVCYRDSRTQHSMDAVFAAVPREKVFAATGIQFMFFNTLFQLHAHANSRSGRDELQRAARLLFMPDLFHYLLSGVAANEITIASTSALLDPASRTWASPLLKSLGLPTHILGDIVEPGTRLGGLLPDVAADAGLSAGISIVAPASHDTASAVAAVPVTDPAAGWCYISSGTWSLMGVETDSPVVDERTLKLNYTNELGANRKVRLLKNIMGLWLVQEVRRDLARHGTDLDYAQLTELARDAAPLRTLLDTWHAPFASPGNMLDKIRTYALSTHQPIPETPGQYVRACLDSLALSYRAVLERLESLTGKPITTIHIVGGGTQNKLLSQLTADATQRTIIAGPVEATALGNALTQALGTGTLPSLQSARELIARSFPLETYRPKNPEPFNNAYPTFLQLSNL
jgi:rhamnulokinase